MLEICIKCMHQYLGPTGKPNHTYLPLLVNIFKKHITDNRNSFVYINLCSIHVYTWGFKIEYLLILQHCMAYDAHVPLLIDSNCSFNFFLYHIHKSAYNPCLLTTQILFDIIYIWLSKRQELCCCTQCVWFTHN